MNKQSDVDLARLIKQGSHTAFKMLYERYCEPLFHYLWSRTGCTNTAEEIVQEVFVRVWKKRQLLNSEKTLKPYLYRIATNLVIDHHRKQKVRVRFAKDEEERSAYLESENIDLKTQIQITLEKLPEKNRTVFILHHLKKYTYEEIASICHVSKKTVEKRMKKAIHLLREDLLA